LTFEIYDLLDFLQLQEFEDEWHVAGVNEKLCDVFEFKDICRLQRYVFWYGRLC
jgi:hypothetical protein